MPDQENSFWLQVGDFGEELLNNIWRTTYDYTLPLILNNDLVGSGTLVTIDSSFGVLTAAHVVIETRWDNSIGAKQALVTTLDSRAAYLWERMENLEWWATKPAVPDWGPDLAFIRLPTSGPLIEQIKKKKSFWPLTKDPSQQLQAANSTDVFATVNGFVAEETRDGESESEFPQVKRLQGYSFIGGPTARHDVDTWDFIDVDGYRSTCSSIPLSFGGVSGGGLWTFRVNRREVSKGTEVMGDLTLAGVAFYELDPKSEKPAVRCHGPRSLYQLSLDQIRAWLRR